jgi:predicted nucleic acid-binding protein
MDERDPDAPAAVFVDTSALYALADRADRRHREGKAIAKRLRGQGTRVFTSNYVVAETHVLLLARLGHQVARRWLAAFAMPTVQVTEADQAAARRLVLDRDDKEWSLTDVTSFCLMKRLGVARAFAFDRHFAQAGMQTLRAR